LPAPRSSGLGAAGKLAEILCSSRPLALAARDKDDLSRLVGQDDIGGDGFATLAIGGGAHGEVDDFPDYVEMLLLLALAA
jgi:hypothetical protein